MSFDQALRDKAEYLLKQAERAAVEAAQKAAGRAFCDILEPTWGNRDGLDNWGYGVRNTLVVTRLPADYRESLTAEIVKVLTAKVLA